MLMTPTGLPRRMQAAFETVVLGLLRPGYRILPLRSKHGTRIRLCSLLVHIELADELNLYAERRDLIDAVRRQQAELGDKEATIRRQQQTIERLTADLEESRAGRVAPEETWIEVDAASVRLAGAAPPAAGPGRTSGA